MSPTLYNGPFCPECDPTHLLTEGEDPSTLTNTDFRLVSDLCKGFPFLLDREILTVVYPSFSPLWAVSGIATCMWPRSTEIHIWVYSYGHVRYGATSREEMETYEE